MNGMKFGGGKSGQALLEYVLVFAALLVLLGAALWFARAARQSAVQTAEIVTCDAP